MKAWLPALGLLLAVGCKKVEFTSVTVAPAERIAEIDTPAGSVRLTRGVALAVSCAKDGARCGNLQVATAAENVASAYLSATDELVAGGYVSDDSDATEEVIVITGNDVGKTTVEVNSDVGSSTLEVEVVAP